MNRELFAEVGEVFLAARELQTGSRTAFLEERCGGRTDLRRAVERLLAKDGHRSDGFDDSAMINGVSLDAFQGMFVSDTTAVDRRSNRDEWLPERIGKFRIIRKLGEGGMGVVCEAEQDGPRRRVAIKLLRMGVGSSGLSRRFEQEAQVLAKLEHPGIARIFEAGTAAMPTGVQPYFAIELINGGPLLDYVVSAGLDIPSRLRVFLQVCDAVEYAHRKGVIHRDLKPANILVDEHGNPRILDFGVARVTDSDLQVSTIHTDPGQLVGTLPYMSPEQVTGKTQLVDTRTDVYALGVVLFELLSGRRPYEVRSKSIDEVLRVIRDQEPTRLGSIDATLRGDLDVIVSHALEKDVERRYSGVGALAADIRRFLRHEPIEARPISRLYQIGKFARRHPELMAALGLGAMALTVGIVVSVWSFMRAVEERDLAKTSAAIAVKREREAEVAAVRARRLTDALSRLMAAARPGEESSATDGTIAKLKDAARAIAEELSDDPEAELRFQDEMGETLTSMMDYGGAIVHTSRARDIAAGLYARSSPDMIERLARVAIAYGNETRTGSREATFNVAAQKLNQEVLQQARKHLGDQHSLTIRLLSQVAELENHMMNAAVCLGLCEELMRVLPSIPERERPCSMASVYGMAAGSCGWLGRMDESQRYADLALESFAAEPADATLDSTRHLEWIIQSKHGFQAASQFLRNQLDRAESYNGRANEISIWTRARLTSKLTDSTDVKEALNLQLQKLLLTSHRWARDQSEYLWTYSHLAQMQARCGRLEDATETYERSLALFRSIGRLGPKGMGEEIWRKAELALHFQTFGKWASTALRNDLRYEFNRLLSTKSFPDLPLHAVGWEALRMTLTPLGGGSPIELRTSDLPSLPDLEFGLYRLDVRLKVGDHELSGTSWLNYAPWRIRRYSHRFLDLNSFEQWQERIAGPPDDEVSARSIMSEVWWDEGFGPEFSQYRFGLVAETTVAYPAGTYVVQLDADDGGRVLIDDRPIIEAWPDRKSGRTTEAIVELTGQPQRWRVEYAQFSGMGRLRLIISPQTK